MTKTQYINKFAEKQGIEFLNLTEDHVLHFEGGRYFEMEDIRHDVDANIKPGLILLYCEEGTNNGRLPDYKTWLTDNHGF